MGCSKTFLFSLHPKPHALSRKAQKKQRYVTKSKVIQKPLPFCLLTLRDALRATEAALKEKPSDPRLPRLPALS